MKNWLAVCILLSGALLGLMLVQMSSCEYAYEVGQKGELSRVEIVIQSPGDPPPPRKLVGADWSTAFPEFSFVSSRVIPGDELVHTRTQISLPLLDGMHMSALEVRRKGAPIQVYRHDALRFWSCFILISIAPVLVWVMVVLASGLASSPRSRGPAE